MSSENNKRIAKNTAMLYFRMLFTMAVSLYTSRVVLNTLGVEDFGIYNVVGGVVTMFSFLNSSMSSATQRFLSFELGKKDFEKLSKVFSMSVTIHALIAITIFLLAETIGLWFLNSKLNIPTVRMEAANWVYQFSVMSFMVSIMSVPYNAAIISHERMNIFAYVSIVEVILKLLIVFILQWFGFDKLKLYAILVFGVSLIIRLVYGIYCKRNFVESKYKFIWDKLLFKNMTSHSGWMLFGTSTNLLSTQGINMLMNIFFNVGVNAARGIAYQLQAAVNSFVSNFMMAVQPQIIKLYAQNQKEEMYRLVFSSSKYSFFLLFFIALPVLLETELIIKWWLKIVPEYVVLFTRLTIIDLFFITLYPSIASVSQAAGKIKFYQIVIALGFLMTFLFTYLFFRIGFDSYVAFIIMIMMSFIGLFARLFILRKQVNFPIGKYVREVLFRIILVLIVSLPIPLSILYLMDNTVIKFLIISFTSVLSIGLSIWLVGIEKNEKVFIKTKFLQLVRKLK